MAPTPSCTWRSTCQVGGGKWQVPRSHEPGGQEPGGRWQWCPHLVVLRSASHVGGGGDQLVGGVHAHLPHPHQLHGGPEPLHSGW